MPFDYQSTKYSGFYSYYLDKIDQSKHGNFYSTLFNLKGDNEVTYRSIWKTLSLKNICPNVVEGGLSDVIESVSIYQVIDLIGEGPTRGLCDKSGNVAALTNNINKNEDILKGVYLNDFPIKNSSGGTFNFNRAFVDVRLGTHDQDLLTSFENKILNFNSRQTFPSGVSLVPLNVDNFNLLPSNLTFVTNNRNLNLVRVGRGEASYAGNYAEPLWSSQDQALQAVKTAEEKQVVKFSHLVTNDNAVAVNLDMGASVAYFSASGNTAGAAVNFAIKVGYEGDDLMVGEGGSVVYIYCSIHGIATSEYIRSFLIPIPPSIEGVDRQVTVFRIDRHVEIGSVKGQFKKEISVKQISEIITEDINYANSCIVGSIFDARAFAQVPKRTYDMKLIKVRIPSNYDPETRFYDGDWDGSFKKDLYWTDNPAWILYDLLTNKRYGLGKYAFQRSFVDKWNLYLVSKYCDEMVVTGQTALVPPMTFTINAGGTEVTIDDSSDLLGEQILLNRYQEGSTVCLYELNAAADGSGAQIKKGYKRIVYRPNYDSQTKKFKFTILQEPPLTKIFEEYPTLKTQYLNSTQKFSERNWIISNWLNSQNSNEGYVTDYIDGLALDSTTRSGLVVSESYSKNDILEPRFNCNVYFDQFQQALDCLNQVAALFRGLIYWANNYIFVSSDKEREPFLLFNNSNVVDGVFNYSGSAKTARHTAALVRYNDKTDNFKSKAVYLEDIDGMREYGYLLKEIAAIGVTSKTQAQRIGRWALYTEQTEQEIVSFNTGAEGSMLLPGDVIKIQDKLKTVTRYGGRITSISYGTKTITLDKGISSDLVGQKISLMVPKAIKSYRDLNVEAKLKLKSSEVALDQTEIDKTRQTQIKEFTISSITNSNQIVISETTDEDFNLIPVGSLWSVQNLDASYNVKEINYRVLSVTEQSQNDYSVSAMLYNSTKFDAIDFDSDLQKNQDSEPQKTIISNLPDPIVSAASDSANIAEANSNFYDGYFVTKTSKSDVQLSVDFSNKTTSLTSQNTGGYIVEVYKDGQKIRFALDGYDNTSFTVFLGNKNLFKYVSYDIYRYDTDYKLENLNL